MKQALIGNYAWAKANPGRYGIYQAGSDWILAQGLEAIAYRDTLPEAMDAAYAHAAERAALDVPC